MRIFGGIRIWIVMPFSFSMDPTDVSDTLSGCLFAYPMRPMQLFNVPRGEKHVSRQLTCLNLP